MIDVPSELNNAFADAMERQLYQAMGIPPSHFEQAESSQVSSAEIVRKMHQMQLSLKARRAREYLDTRMILLFMYESWQVLTIMAWYRDLGHPTQEAFFSLGGTWGLLEHVIYTGWGYKPKKSWRDLTHIICLWQNKRLN